MKNTSKTAVPPAALPPWKCLNRRDADKLIEWTISKLDQEHAITEMFIQLGEFTRLNTFTPLVDGQPPVTLLPTFEYAMEVFRETGDLTLLQQADPDYAEYLSRKKRGRPAKSKDEDRIWQAVWDVILIRQIWKEHFGKFYRSGKDKVVVTAEQIAKERNRINRDADRVTFEQRLRKLKKRV
jgi:hypothetical protein